MEALSLTLHGITGVCLCISLILLAQIKVSSLLFDWDRIHSIPRMWPFSTVLCTVFTGQPCCEVMVQPVLCPIFQYIWILTYWQADTMLFIEPILWNQWCPSLLFFAEVVPQGGKSCWPLRSNNCQSIEQPFSTGDIWPWLERNLVMILLGYVGQSQRCCYIYYDAQDSFYSKESLVPHDRSVPS